MRTLSHPEARQRLQAAANGHLEIADQPALDAHLSACAECRAYAAELTVVEDRLRQIFAQRWDGARGPQPDLARLLAHRGANTMQRSFWPNLAGGLAALLLVAAIAFTLQVQTRQPASGSGLGGNTTLAAATEAVETPPPFTTVVLDPTIVPAASDPIETPAPDESAVSELSGAAVSTETPAPDVSATPESSHSAGSPNLNYVVQPGDTCQSIAAAYAVALNDMLAANNMDTCATLAVDKTLIIPHNSADAPPICPVTVPPAPPFVPPAPYDGIAPMAANTFWYGTADLWTRLRVGGVWHDLPYHSGGFAQKVFWWRDGYNWLEEPSPELTVSSTRLDVPGDTYVSDWASNGFAPDTLSFMNAGPILPTAGCWQITGHYGEHSLSFVVWVVP